MLVRPRLSVVLRLAICAIVAWVGLSAFLIMHAARSADAAAKADAAIVLGAAAYGELPSPVFEARLRYAVELYKAHRVKRLIFTGGRGGGASIAESEVGRSYGLARGIPADDMLIETNSHTTMQNLVEARKLMERKGIASVLIVSDPLHLKRSLAMCSSLGLDCEGAGTPYSMYQSLSARAGFAAREVLYYNLFLVAGI